MSGAYREDALVFSVRADDEIGRTAETCARGEPDETGLGFVLDFVGRNDGVSIQLVHERPETQQATKMTQFEWAVAVPSAGPSEKLDGVHYLRLPSAQATDWLERQLRRDPRVRHVHRPAVFSAPREIAPADAEAPDEPAWWLTKCHFTDAGPAFMQCDRLEPIATLDIGRDSSHPDIDPWLDFIAPVNGQAPPVEHGARVASIIAARPSAPNGMTGCCETTVQFHSVHNDSGYDPVSAYRHLADIVSKRYRVLNVSMQAPHDQTVEEHIQACADAGVIVVAAMGNDGLNGSPPVFPAADPNVIAVGAVDAHDRRLPESSEGPHIWITAPGLFLTTVQGATGYNHQSTGTSFAAPMVAAAVVLMLCVDPSLTRDDVRSLLARSAASSPPGGRNNEVGHGRLDLLALKQILIGP